MGRLTTHVLDLTTGKPAQGLEIELWSLEDDTSVHLKTVQTNEDGRVDEPRLKGSVLVAGIYELRFKAGEYLSRHGLTLPDPLFLDIIPSRFGVAEPDSDYHIPLLLSAYGYSTYRGG